MDNAISTIMPIAAGIFMIIVIVVMIMLLSPKTRGKWMAHQMKASEEMLKSAKPTLKNIAGQAAEMKKEILEENQEVMKEAAEMEAEIESVGTKAKAKAATEGIKEGLSGKKS